MKPAEVEAWALNVIDRVERRQPIEDIRVELNAGWIDTSDMARKVAGHSNTARGLLERMDSEHSIAEDPWSCTRTGGIP